VAQQECENIEEEAQQRILRASGQVEQAEVLEDDGSQSRRRTLLYTGITVILSRIIIGSALGTRDTSPSEATMAPTVTPFGDDSLCGEVHPPFLIGGAVVASLRNGISRFLLLRSPGSI
jgi:hypothetical protein